MQQELGLIGQVAEPEERREPPPHSRHYHVCTATIISLFPIIGFHARAWTSLGGPEGVGSVASVHFDCVHSMGALFTLLARRCTISSGRDQVHN